MVRLPVVLPVAVGGDQSAALRQARQSQMQLSGDRGRRGIPYFGEVAQGAETGEKEIRPAAQGNKLRQAGDALRDSVFLRPGEIRSHRARWHRLTVSQQRIGLVGQPGELAGIYPGILEEFELAQNVGVQAEELQAAFRIVRRRRRERILG